MATYICPMHPEIRQSTPGKCPKCGMNLVLEGGASSQTDSSWQKYTPLIVIIGIVLLTTVVLATRDAGHGSFTLSGTISYFMIGFFLVFSGFKLMDLSGFAEGYSMYDLLAQRWKPYGYIYPFIELFFALAMIMSFAPRAVLWAEAIIMTFSGLGVAIKLSKKEPFQCACLGTFLKVPLTTITLIEDFGMAGLALVLLFSPSF